MQNCVLFGFIVDLDVRIDGKFDAFCRLRIKAPTMSYCANSTEDGCNIHLGTWNFSDICLYIRNTQDLCEGGGRIPYTKSVFCNHSASDSVPWLIFCGFLVLLLEYFLALSIAADGFFCPSLAVIVDHLKISHNIAVSNCLSKVNSKI